MKPWYIIDRFEGDYAVCEGSDGEMVNILRILLPANAKEGDVLSAKEKNGCKSYLVDEDKTKVLHEQAENMMKSLHY